MTRFVVRILALTMCLAAATLLPPTAYAGLTFQYTGTILEIDDPYSVFANTAVSVGDTVIGEVSFGVPISPGANLGYVSSYSFAVTPDGVNRMTARAGNLNLAAQHSLLVQVYNPADYGASGIDFQFIDADVAQLSTTALPPGYKLKTLSTYLTLFSASNPGSSTFPNLPSSLLDLSQYDSPDTIGFFSVDVFDARGAYLTSSSMAFNFTSIQAVPEPSSLALCLLCIAIVLPKRRYFASRQMHANTSDCRAV